MNQSDIRDGRRAETAVDGSRIGEKQKTECLSNLPRRQNHTDSETHHTEHNKQKPVEPDQWDLGVIVTQKTPSPTALNILNPVSPATRDLTTASRRNRASILGACRT